MVLQEKRAPKFGSKPVNLCTYTSISLTFQIQCHSPDCDDAK
jgi:hypothetical protein